MVGCGAAEEKAAKAKADAAKAKAREEAKAAADAEANATVTPKPEPPKTEPKVEVKKPLTEEESAKVIEAAIRKRIKKPTGELTKADLEKVSWLNVRGTGRPSALQLTDVKGLEKLTLLKELYLQDNQLTDVKGLEKLTKLTELRLENNQLTDVKGLEKLTKLKTLWLIDNPDLTKAQIDQLKKALPKCKIYHNAKE